MTQHATAMTCPRYRRSGVFALAYLLCAGAAFAQQTPLTRKMLELPRTDAAPAATPAAPPAAASTTDAQPSEPRDYRIGDGTHALLRMQADGSHAGRRLPILGDQASASYQRYLKSFEHEIPEFYEAKVAKGNAGGADGGH